MPMHSFVLLLTLILAALGTLVQPSARQYPDTRSLRDAVSSAGILRRLEAFQQIATANNGNRAAGTPGYSASVEYVRSSLSAAGYSVTIQEFPFVHFSVETEEGRMVGDGTRDLEPRAMAYSPSTPPEGVELPLAVVPTERDPGVGCEAADFTTRAYTGTIALILRGTCPFAEKARNARDAGATAALIYNNDQDPSAEVVGTLGGPDQATIPVAGITRSAGEALRLATAGGSREARVFLNLQTTTESRTTSNVLAETQGGDPAQVVMVGAHLDSVEEGAGINDNGSGSATILEIALHIAQGQMGTKNKVRFAFWGAEELGALGSQHYVEQLSDVERERIALYLNLDMVGSPNFTRFVYADDDANLGTGQATVTLEQLFRDYFEARRQPVTFIPIGDRSDHAAFAAVGIPVGGLFTGAEGVKTQAEAEQAGGTAGTAYDACYHRSCDTLDNLSLEALDQMADAAAHAILSFAIPIGSSGEATGRPAWCVESKLIPRSAVPC